VAEAGVALPSWRGIDELAELVGGYCWAEKRIFEVAGAWATGADSHPGDGPIAGLEPALRVWCAGTSRRHGQLAARWAERLPVRAGVDRATLVRPPGGPLGGAFAELAAPSDARAGVAALVGSVLPRLQAAYGAHSRTPNPVSEASVLEVLTGAHRDLVAEISTGRALLEGSPGG
jgi:hypothetical protein